MKFLHCSDLHLGKRPAGVAGEYALKRYQDYFDAFQYLIEEGIKQGVRAVILGGDIFDKKELNPDVLAKAEAILSIPRSENIPVIITDGNHDRIITGAEQDSWLKYLEGKELIKIPKHSRILDEFSFSPIIVEGITFWGLGYAGAFARETIEGFVEYLDSEPNKSNKNVAIIHTGIIDNAKERDDTFITRTIDKETAEYFNGKLIYVAGGHLHSYSVYPKDKPFFFVPGSPEFWDIDEAGKIKGGIVFDTDTLEHKLIKAKNRNVHRIVVRDEFYTTDELLSVIHSKIVRNEISIGEDLIKIEIEIKNSFIPDTNVIEAEMGELGFLKTFVKFIGKQSTSNSPTSFSGIEVIESEIIEKWEKFGEKPEITLNHLSKFKVHITEGNLDQLSDVFDAFLNEFVAGGKK